MRDLMSEAPPATSETPPTPFLKHAITLWFGGMVGVVAVMPYVMEMGGQQLEEAAAELGLGIVSIIAISVVQSAALLAVTVCAGLWAARKLDLRAPVTAALVTRQPVFTIAKQFLGLSLIVGALVAALVVAVDLFVFQPLIPELQNSELPRPAIWKGALASLYGGIAEELLCRLFLLSLLALFLRWLARTPKGLPSWIFWTANLLVALLFGLGHLPAAASILPLTPVWVTRVLVLNGLFAVAAGYLFWKRGLESAMLAHWAADIVFHVIAPLLSSPEHGA